MAIPDKATADELSRAPKIIGEDVVAWRAVGDQRYRLEARVVALDHGRVLKLVGNIGCANYGFALLYENLPIRKLTKHHRHQLPSGEYVYGLHKHVWDEHHRDGNAYSPPDIDPHSDVNEAFLAFLAEENITLRGSYQPLMLR